MKDHLTLALPKGRVFAESVSLLQRAGLSLTLDKEDRALMIEAGDAAIIELRNADVPTYVEVGVADAGIVGKDVLLEAGRSIYEPVDLKFSHCRMSLIRPQGERGSISRVASKFPNVTQRYFAAKHQPIEVIKLSGNVELACLTGLADAVVDIVQTGQTLKANKLEEVEVLFHSSARFVVNRAALKLKTQTLRPLIESLRKLVAS
jgi:ATP phosphoribosyltransferase